MIKVKSLFKRLKDYLYFIFFLVFLGIIFSLPFLNTLNYSVLDTFQGQIDPRKEIVIIGIDDLDKQDPARVRQLLENAQGMLKGTDCHDHWLI